MNSNKSTKTAINPTRSANYPEWYQQVIKAADLAEVSPVRGCMIIKPWGFAIWENIQAILNKEFQATGHKNLYFPLLIPMSYLQKEAEHIEGFAKECAVVTHSRLVKDSEGKLIPGGELEEPYIIRPTSETIIGDAFSRWIQSYRDLPLKINQWANIIRWEMRTRLFLRTTEFLWQEGHTAHASAEEAKTESLMMLDVYAKFAENFLAMPVLRGEKTENERFPGAVNTYCIEAMMQDKKALQAGTSHFLGQHFAKSFNIRYLSSEGKEEYVYTTSWGVSTRLVGGLIMTHSDDNGLVLPPKIAPLHIVILPIAPKEEDKESIYHYCAQIAAELRTINYLDHKLKVEIDNRALTGGEKSWSWVKKGVPIRLEIGKKELASQSVFMGRRDQQYHERKSIPLKEFMSNVVNILDEMQNVYLTRAQNFQQQNTSVINDKKTFYEFFQQDGGFAKVHWAGDNELENQLKQELGISIRCILFTDEPGNCIFTNKPGKTVVFAKAY